ncbi:MAG: hypothetical protein H0S78_00465 [Tissierellales bacterium]|jgi:hypothetical protein|nr:hypothetical protein [Tissierellales bacterium]
MEKIKVVSEDTTTNKAAPKEKDFQPQSQEFNVFMNTLASVVEKHGAEILKDIDCAV